VGCCLSESLTLWVCSGKAQIAESKHRLRRLLDEADDAVTMVRVGGDDVENSRRSGAENMRLDRRRRLLAEAELSAKVCARALQQHRTLLQQPQH